MNKGMLTRGLIVATLLWVPTAAAAQRPPGGGGPPAKLTVTPTEVVFPSPTGIEYELGWVEASAVDITIEPRGNRNSWQLFVAAVAADMGGYGKPVQDVQVRYQGSASWVPLGTTEQLVAEGSGVATITIHYRLLLDWTADVPGTYSVPLEYSAASF